MKHRRLWHAVALAVAAAGTAVVALSTFLRPRPASAIGLMVCLLAVWFLALARPQAQDRACLACGATADPVRSAGGRRLWTCRACGHERPRQRSRQQLDRGSIGGI